MLHMFSMFIVLLLYSCHSTAAYSMHQQLLIMQHEQDTHEQEEKDRVPGRQQSITLPALAEYTPVHSDEILRESQHQKAKDLLDALAIPLLKSHIDLHIRAISTRNHYFYNTMLLYGRSEADNYELAQAIAHYCQRSHLLICASSLLDDYDTAPHKLHNTMLPLFNIT